MAMSAGTMLACSAKTIIMGKHSCLGPIDPQYGGVPAYNIVAEFSQAKADLLQDPQAKTYWELQLKKYPAAFLYSVLDSINLSSALVSDWLTNYMFEGEDPKVISKKVKAIVNKLNANNKSHSRHFTYDFCKGLGMNVEELEADQSVQEAVLSIHHAFVITIDSTVATKLIENQDGARYITSQGK